MLLAVGYVVGPVTGVGSVVVQQREGALLVSGSTIPALPVSCTRSSMSEDSILPMAIRGAFRRLPHHSVIIIRTTDFVRIVTILEKTLQNNEDFFISTLLVLNRGHVFRV